MASEWRGLWFTERTIYRVCIPRWMAGIAKWFGARLVEGL